MEGCKTNLIKQEFPKENVEMYQEFCKLTIYNKLLNERYESLLVEKDKLKQKLDITADTLQNGSKKRFRRNADQIKRIYNCSNCGKAYGSEASLKNHVKFKHSSLQEPLI
jgi:predicted nucleotide-binding protein (sugar kinase/HSP70/actin superfamily)